MIAMVSMIAMLGMTAVARARALYQLRVRAAEWWGLIVVAAVWLLLAVGAPSRGVAAVAVVLAVYAATLLRALRRELLARPASPRRAAAHELELGLLLVTAVYLLIAVTGGPRSPLYPLVYALVSFLTVLHRRRPAVLAWLAATVALELLVARHFAAGRVLAVAGYHLTFIAFFAAGNLLVLSGLVRRLRRGHAARLDAELARMRREARDFRVIAAQQPLAARPGQREEEEVRMAQGAVQTIREQIAHQVALLRRALGLHTCAVLWRSEAAPGGLAVVEISSAAAAELVDDPELDAAGVLAGVLRDPTPLRLRGLHGKRLPPYYRVPVAITDLLALPLVDDGAPVGVLCADRDDGRPFDDADEGLLAAAAQQIARVVAHERVFAAVERGRYEQEQFYRASEHLGAALTLEQVYAKTFAAIQAIRPYDLAVITGHDAHAHHHKVLALDAPGERDPEHGRAWADVAARLADLTFEDGSGLVALAVKNRHPLPASDDAAPPEAVVFTPRTRLGRARSLLVLPLVHGEQVLGAITLASARERLFPADARAMLRVISNQVAVSLQNARMYASMEERATTDGLTGLTNHRSFQERFAGLHALAERRGGKLAVILTDIDHFKKINDTYGHPVGDAVLRRVAAIFAGRSRKVDIVARYGGEEFVIVLPDTDGAGAEVFANKLREEIAAQTMTSDKGPFKITISMGIAEYPQDGQARAELIERADQALYQCKRGGRNCVHRWSQVKGAAPRPAKG